MDALRGNPRQTLGEPRVLLSRTALLHNVGVIRAALDPGVKICAVVKADAYGHSAALVADTLCNFSSGQIEAPAVDALAVATIDEAAALPAVDVPVIVLRPVENAYVGRQRAKLEEAVRNGWSLTVCTPAAAQDVARVAVSAGARANVQIMVDTGLTRSGAPETEVAELAAHVRATPTLRLTGIYSHFASADDATSPFNADQLCRFELATASSVGAAARITRHLANSAAVFNLGPSVQFDMVRPGISLYGIDPAGRPSPARKLRPVLKWTAPLLMIHDVKKGGSVGYAQSWKAPQDGRVGLVPVGYADGYFRNLGNNAFVMLQGRPLPVVGRVSMDFITIDLTSLPGAQVGDEVTVLDNDPLSPASAYALAQAAGTIPYEVFCRIGARIARVAVDPVDAPTPASQDR